MLVHHKYRNNVEKVLLVDDGLKFYYVKVKYEIPIR